MMVGPCCELILKGVPLASSLQLYKEDKNLDLIGFHDNHIFTFKLHNEICDTHQTPIQCSCQELRIEAGIISVFKWTDKYYILDRKGVLHQMTHSSVDTDSADLFDDTSPDDGALNIKKVCHITHSDVVSAAFIPPDFLAVVSYRKENSDLLVAIHHLDTAETVRQSLVVNRNVLSKPVNLFLEYVSPNDIEKEFVSSWFPHFNKTDSSRGFLFIYNCDEKACCVQLGFDSLHIGFFFSWPSPCVFSSFRPSIISGGELMRSSLILSFADGAVIGLSSSGGKILNFTISQAKSVSMTDKCLLSSDYTDCQVTPLDPVNTCSLLPIKGVIAFCVLDGRQAQVLALTNHGGLYLLRAEVKLMGGKCQIPAVSSFQETLNKIGYLEELHSRIDAQDSYIKCLATVANARNFHFKLDLQVVQIMADHHLFRVTCESLAANTGSSPVLQAKDWHVVFTLSHTNHDRVVHVQQLPCDFSKNQPLEFMVRLKLETHDSRDCMIVVKLISFVGEGKYRPTLLLGKGRLSVLSFLEPECSLLTHLASSSLKSPSVMDLLRSQSLDLGTEQSAMKDAKESRFVLEIPTGDVVAQEIVEKLLERSKALWRVKPWELSQSSSRVRVVVHNHAVSVEIRDDKAIVSCCDPGLAILMKYAITNIIRKLRLEGFDEAVLMETENILQSLEIMEVSEEGLSCSAVYDIYKRKVKFINDSLIGVSTVIE